MRVLILQMLPRRSKFYLAWQKNTKIGLRFIDSHVFAKRTNNTIGSTYHLNLRLTNIRWCEKTEKHYYNFETEHLQQYKC